MREYPEIRYVLKTIFAVDVGLSEQASEALFRRALSNENWRRIFEKELEIAFADPEVSWSELLFNDQYEVYQADSEDEARELAISLLWSPTFPGRPTPARAER